MSAEIRAISRTVDVTVTKVSEIPLHLKVIGDMVYVYPMQHVDLKVTAGELYWDGFESVTWPGAVLEFKDEVVKQIGMDGTSDYTVIYAISSKSLQYGTASSNISFRVDQQTGTIFASEPCDAIVVFASKDVMYNRYKYTPPSFTYNPSRSSGSGTQLDAAIPETFSAVVYAIYKPVGWPSVKAQIAQASVQMPVDNKTYDAYTVNIPTILTSAGEWIKPLAWESDSYDKTKAYQKADGTYAEGPDKDEPWAGNNQTIQKGRVDSSGNITHIQTSLPQVKGSDALPLENAEKRIVTSELNPAVKLNTRKEKTLKDAVSKVTKDYNAVVDPVSKPIIPITTT